MIRAATLGTVLMLTAPGAVCAETDNPPQMAGPGPSFACPTPRDPLGQLVCDNPRLSQADLALVQVYQALRQQSAPAQYIALRNEAAGFAAAVRTDCGVGGPARPDDPPPSPPQAAASSCVAAAYERQRTAWRARLTGAAAQEASRPLDTQILLQRDLQVIALLPPGEPIDGVYGANTRAAILAFQQTMGLPPTGLIGDTDAQALMREARRIAPARQPSHAPWDDFQGEAAASGITVSAALGSPCTVSFQIRNPEALAQAAATDSASTAAKPVEPDTLFRNELGFLRSRFAAHGVQAFYATEPASIDRCRFEVIAFTMDIYGRDIPQPLFGFQFDRDTYQKVVWNRFDPVNLPKIAPVFEYSVYTRERLHMAAE